MRRFDEAAALVGAVVRKFRPKPLTPALRGSTVNENKEKLLIFCCSFVFNEFVSISTGRENNAATNILLAG